MKEYKLQSFAGHPENYRKVFLENLRNIKKGVLPDGVSFEIYSRQFFKFILDRIAILETLGEIKDETVLQKFDDFKRFTETLNEKFNQEVPLDAEDKEKSAEFLDFIITSLSNLK